VVTIVVVERDGEQPANLLDLEVTDLGPALLTETDIGHGFVRRAEQQQHPLEGGFAHDLRDSADANTACHVTLDPSTTGGEVGPPVGQDRVLAVFEDGGGDDAVVVHTLWLRDPDDPTLDEVAEGWHECDQVTYRQDGDRYELHLDADKVDGLGDEALAVQREIDIEGNADVDDCTVLVRQDNVMSSIYASEPIDDSSFEPCPLTLELLADWAVIVDSRIAGLAPS
jgi:hypothetical protein